ncbi:hypothetical protein O181_046297 [Austropuccinia psidii MF-1]|uniref:Integrase catalytic domain-containing protein n=1 Tax=Austropuccinia psidii MF-1 TaxID=1389203 RepID=A0A9Q3DVJ6_9BASI|nr:hypothetical protein [Austropuccinia psidii MF-1]
MNCEDNAEGNSIPILKNSNYGEWVSQMTILLRSKDLLDVREKPIPSDLSTTATNKWNKSMVKQFSKKAHLLWTKLEEQYASKKAVNRGRVWMQWLKFNYDGNLQHYINNRRTLMMALETVNITIPDECHSFSLVGKLSGDPKLRSISPSASALLSESAHPYKITYFCSNGKHNPMCTTHSKNKCYDENPHLRPPRRNNKTKNQVSAHLSTAQALITRNKLDITSQELIIDCGATHHMFNSPRYFTSFTQRPEINVSTGDLASTLVLVGTGTVVILCGNQVFTLENSLLVPRLNCNLVSLLALSNKKMVIQREGDSFTLETGEKGTIEGKIISNLMLGHPGNPPIKAMGLPTVNSVFSTCDLNKMRMLPFNDNSGDVSQPLDCVHLDLVGPISPASISGFRYFLTIVDQATSFKIVSLLKLKSNAFDQSIIVKNHIENLHDRKIKTVVSDRDGEFARCILNRSNLPKSYWAEAVSTSTFLSNLTPTPSRSNLSLYVIWKGLPPRIRRLWVFGCRAIILIPKSQRDWKFNAVGSEGVFLGYENDNTTYRLLRLCNLNIVISKHVKFEENVFPRIQAPSLRDEAWIVPWNNQLESTETVDEFRQSGHSLVDELQKNDSLHSVEDSSRLVDEAQESSSSATADENPVPANRPCIEVIGPRHPTLIMSSINSGNILPYH